MQQFCEMSSIFEVDNVKNEAILRDFLNFQVGKIKNEAILRDFLQKWKVECRADCLLPMRFAMFPLHLSKVLRLPRKSDARSYEVLHLSRKITFPTLTIWCSKMQPLSGNLRPDLLSHLPHVSLALRLPREMHLSRSSSNVPRLPSFLKLPQNPHVLLTFDKVHNPLRLPRKTTSERPKALRTPQFLALLTSKCASRHNGVHFWNISNFQKWSEHGVFCTFWLGHVLRATTACTFSTSQLPNVVRPWRALCILTLQCASRHNRVQLFISHLASWLRTRRFSEPTFRPSGATNHWKNTVFRDFLPFRAPGSPFFWKFLLVGLLSSSLLFSDSSHLCVSSVHIVGSLSSKLRSMMRSSWVCFRTEAVTRHQGSACVDSGGGCKLAQYGSAQGLGEPLWEINGKIMKWKPHVFGTSTWQSHKLTWCFSVSRAGRGKRGDGDKG